MPNDRDDSRVVSDAPKRGLRVLLVADSPAERFTSMDLYAGWVHRALEASDHGTDYQLLRPSVNMKHGELALKLVALRNRYVTIPRAIHGNQADIVHVLDQAYGHLVPTGPPARVVVTCHDLIPLEAERWGNGSRKSLSLGWYLYRKAVGHLTEADAIVVPTAATKRRLVGLLSLRDDRVSIIPMGVDEAFHLGRWRRPPAGLRILHVGSNAHYKRVELLVEAVVRLAAGGHRIELIKAGPRLPHNLADQVSRAGIKLIQHELTSDGKLRTPSEQAAIYETATLLLLPSSQEGFGIPVAEAMAVGLPVVATDIDSLREVSGGHAAHAPGEATALAATVERLVREPGTLERMSDAGRRWARRYQWASYATALREVYAAVISPGGKRVSTEGH